MSFDYTKDEFLQELHERTIDETTAQIENWLWSIIEHLQAGNKQLMKSMQQMTADYKEIENCAVSIDYIDAILDDIINDDEIENLPATAQKVLDLKKFRGTHD